LGFNETDIEAVLTGDLSGSPFLFLNKCMNTLTCPIPDNITPLSPNGFLFSVQKLPQLNFFCQQVNLPGIMLGAPEFGNPLQMQPIPGESLTYDQLQVQFLVDEKMENYISIYNWIVALGFPNDYEQYTNFINEDQRGVIAELSKNYSDGTLQILTHNNQVARTVQFVDMFPTAIDSLMFQGTNTDVNYLVGNVTFRYGYYLIT
jgi:hypothetical protein